jgi:uncharacterized protein YbjT (DUF2867 family)
MILVVGATGVLGSSICRALRARDLPVRAFVRPGSPKASALRDIGVELFEGDLREHESIDAACVGISTVISTATAMGATDKSLTLRDIDRYAHLHLVRAAASKGVEQFIYISASPNLVPTAPLIRYKREVERAVRASGMRWTILQPSCFMEVWLSSLLGWDFVKAKASIFGAGTAPISWISATDVAEHAVQSLDDPRFANRDVPLGGPEAMSSNAVVKIFESVSGRSYRTTHVPRPLLLVLSPVAAFFNEGVASGMSLGAQSAMGDIIDSPLQRELALPLTTVREYATRVLHDS